MTIVDGWFSFAERMPGPLIKTWPDINRLQGYIPHSAVGGLGGVISRVMDVTPPLERRVSIHGVIGYDGRVIQFYPVTASPWGSGSHDANRIFLAFENEGGVDTPATVHEPLTEAQIAVNVRIIQELQAYKRVSSDYWRRPTSASDNGATLYEHNECTRFGSSSTACPSGRIPWAEIIRRLTMPDPNAPVLPEWQAVAGASASAVHFLRNGIDMKFLSDADKEAIRALAKLI